MTTNQEQLLQELVRLTSAVKDLADRRPTPAPDREVSEAERVRQRVAFGYQALGSLLGRVSSGSGREFDVRVVVAERRRGVILLDRLPRRARWVELRRGTKVELLPIYEGADVREAIPEEKRTPRSEDREGDDDRGAVFPERFADTEPIGSIVVLRTRQGPVVAFGPRLDPLTATDHRSTA